MGLAKKTKVVFQCVKTLHGGLYSVYRCNICSKLLTVATWALFQDKDRQDVSRIFWKHAIVHGTEIRKIQWKHDPALPSTYTTAELSPISHIPRKFPGITQ